ncbi:hypothetical protein CSV71_03880 [Sporosarcina sp. P21c]|uniref:hypothetical protein n=1 Tax=unclassified Sporosarcina TaxID=2647733 RepID=UPI000C1692CC|nr:MULTISPECIES: hypothetical protein [unclassified Sporosarcina]PIC67858.1 hypothetical protein CSV78_05970 [Sporosarcina sp. P16a]PIC90717.1 hypothetical protein CSV71_03880 [Sporosarcina sp. P21c]PIC93482.1 hypothetical protein CSV70_05835 [Sporosarcina sp. P25]
MQTIIEILGIVLPIIIAGFIVLFVIKRLDQKTKQGAMPKKKSKSSQTLLDSLIPLGMLAGCIVGLLISMISPISLGFAFSLGASLGLLGGYFAYESYGNKEEI